MHKKTKKIDLILKTHEKLSCLIFSLYAEIIELKKFK